MAKLIADSGATKTAWRVTGSKLGGSIYTDGLNPYYHTQESIVSIVEEDLLPQIKPNSIDKVHFYGAGCDSPEKVEFVEDALSVCFGQRDINVYHDLLGAARACCLNEPGIACILGTGSNSCHYDGIKIVEHTPALAFILGDEGSAGYLGKKLINSYFRGEVPDRLAADLEEDYNMDLDYIMDNLYNQDQFSRFIASYAAFLGKNANHPFAKEMLREGFTNFIVRIIKKYSGAEELNINFIGSVATSHQEMIKEILHENGMHPGIFIKNPMDRLMEFHEE